MHYPGDGNKMVVAIIKQNGISRSVMILNVTYWVESRATATLCDISFALTCISVYTGACVALISTRTTTFC